MPIHMRFNEFECQNEKLRENGGGINNKDGIALYKYCRIESSSNLPSFAIFYYSVTGSTWEHILMHQLLIRL